MFKLNIRNKMLASLLVVSLAPILIITLLAVNITRNALSERAFLQLKNIREVKKNQVMTFLNERETDLMILLETVDGLKQAAFDKLTAAQENKKAQIQKYFSEIAKDVLVIAKSETTIKALSDFKSTINSEGQVDRILYDFFVNEKYGQSLVKLNQVYGYHDLLLLTDTGDIIFSCNGNTPIHRNVDDKSLLESGIGECYRSSLKGLSYRDFAPYPFEKGRHLAFMGCPVRDRSGKVSGVMIVLFTNKGINEITLRRQGMGKTGETYLSVQKEDNIVLRSRRHVVDKNIGNKVSDVNFKEKLARKTVPIIENDETGTPEIVIYDRIDIFGTNYYLTSRLGLKEVIDPRSTQNNRNYFLTYLQAYEYLNLYLISPDGTVFFTAHDENTGEYDFYKDNESGLGRLYQQVKTSRTRSFVDFSQMPANDEPFAYIGVPLMTTDKDIEMIVALKLSPQGFNRIMQTSQGMAESLDVYLVGPDHLMRSNSYLLPEKYSVQQSFKFPDKLKINTLAVKKSLDGITGEQQLSDYRNETVLSSFTPIDVMGTRWAVVAEINKKVALESLRTLLALIIFSSLAFAAGIFFLSLFVAERFSSPIKQLTMVAERIQAHDFDIKVEVPKGDEFEALGNAFNAMSETINSHARSLEQKIVQLQTAQNDIRRSEERFRSLVETTSDWIWETDEKGVYTYVSPTIKNMLGYTPAEVLGKTPFDLMPDTQKEKIAALFFKFSENKKPFSNLENVNRHKNGHLVVLETSGVPFFTEDNELKGYRGIDRDITQRRRYEEELLMTESVFTNTIEGIAITDKDGIIQKVNQAFCDITGYSAKDAVGQNPRILKSDRHDETYYTNMWQDLIEKGHWSGEIWNRRKDGSLYPEWLSISAVKDPSGKITSFVSLFHDISEKKNKEEQLQFLAFHDPLTKLPNRTLLYDRINIGLKNAKRNHKKMAILYMDIDNFKNINDSYGHPFGDEFLCRVKDRIKKVCRETDTFARYGGDEFVIVLNDVEENEHVVDFSNRIIELFKTPLKIFDEEIYSSLSIGLSVYPDDGEDIVTLEKNADMALYEAKKYGKQQSFLFKQSLKDKMLRKTHLENVMRRSIEDYSSFSLMYQPKVNTNKNQIYGVEVLLRWHVDGAPVSPMEFIPIAEENNLIISIGEWIMEKAMTDFIKIHSAGFNDLFMSINLSSKQFNDMDLLRKINSTLDKTGFNPSRLCFEITESIPMENTKQAIEIMEKLYALGIKLSMDDFGTGYSSLSVLKKFPLTELKIDRAFIKDLPENKNDAAISKTIIQMANSLNFDVVAEGVETIEQLNFLKENQCHMIQGYYFYKPLSFDELFKVLKDSHINA